MGAHAGAAVRPHPADDFQRRTVRCFERGELRAYPVLRCNEDGRVRVGPMPGRAWTLVQHPGEYGLTTCLYAIGRGAPTHSAGKVHGDLLQTRVGGPRQRFPRPRDVPGEW